MLDLNQDNVSLDVFIDPIAESFLTFQESSRTIRLVPNSNPIPGNYTIVFTLEDDNPNGKRTTTYQIRLEVFDQTQEQIRGVTTFAPNFGDPVPTLVSISSKGDVLMKWSTKMVDKSNMTEVESQMKTPVRVNNIETKMVEWKPALEIYNAYDYEG